MKKCVATLCVTVVLILNLTPAQAEQWEPSQQQTAQERFRDKISGDFPSIKDIMTGEEKMSQQQTGKESFMNAMRSGLPSIRDVMTGEEKMRQKGFFGYGTVADYVIVFFMILGGIVTLCFFISALRSFGKSTDLAKMIQKYKDDYANPRIVLELYQYCYNHKLLSPIIRRYNASVGDFSLIYMYLLSHCPAVGKGHFIPISTFFFAASLDYVLARENFLNFDDTLWLRRYFGLID